MEKTPSFIVFDNDDGTLNSVYIVNRELN